MQWYDFRKQVLGGIRNQMHETIQVIGPIVRNDVLDRVDIDCESFRGVGVRNATKFCKRYSRETSAWAHQLASDVDRKLIQTSQRGGKQGVMINGLYTSMRESIGGREESTRKHPNPENLT